ncbi:GNAT family N-acetyltransferase [Micromonospora coxensis]|uniref:GNAT family N-acetyltransferase n=1 Tax=Micromonospora coxensis TaxID=356852 RepID=UPI00342B11AF
MTVRPAGPADLPALVALRIANAEAHSALDPTAYRVPDSALVADHFRDVLAAGRDAVLLAEAADGQVVGMVEVLRQADPPAHQILRPEPSAAVHTVVLPGHRGEGVGAALLAAAAQWASAHEITWLSAGIHHRNDGAVSFYRRHGFEPSGLSLGRRLPPSS